MFRSTRRGTGNNSASDPRLTVFLSAFFAALRACHNVSSLLCVLRSRLEIALQNTTTIRMGGSSGLVSRRVGIFLFLPLDGSRGLASQPGCHLVCRAS